MCLFCIVFGADIDECANSETSPCVSKSICINKPGSVSCSCRKGYHGDGRKKGEGCIPSKLFNIFIGNYIKHSQP